MKAINLSKSSVHVFILLYSCTPCSSYLVMQESRKWISTHKWLSVQRWVFLEQTTHSHATSNFWKKFSWNSLWHFSPISIEGSILLLPGNQAIKTQSHTHVYGLHKWGDPDPLSKNNGRNSKLDITFFETLSICWHFLELWHPCPRVLGHCVSPLTENNDVTSTLSNLSARHTFSWHQPPPGSALLGFDPQSSSRAIAWPPKPIRVVPAPELIMQTFFVRAQFSWHLGKARIEHVAGIPSRVGEARGMADIFIIVTETARCVATKMYPSMKDCVGWSVLNLLFFLFNSQGVKENVAIETYLLITLLRIIDRNNDRKWKEGQVTTKRCWLVCPCWVTWINGGVDGKQYKTD